LDQGVIFGTSLNYRNHAADRLQGRRLDFSRNRRAIAATPGRTTLRALEITGLILAAAGR
jgi:hypothetical protein